VAPVVAACLFSYGVGCIGVVAATQQAAPPPIPQSSSEIAAAGYAISDSADVGPAYDPRVQSSAQNDIYLPLPVAAPRSPQREETAAPTRLRIPSIGATSELESLALDSRRVLEVPEDPDVAGWFSRGSRPGATGAAVLTGHVDSDDGPGVFYNLGILEQGAKVLVDRKDGSTAVFRVDRVEQYAKDELPTVQVYAASGRELRLVTCGGTWDENQANYADNIVAYATLIDTR